MKDVSPPAIVRSDSAEMDQLAFQVTTALEAGAKAARTTLERYREAGESLAKAKRKCKHGEWLPWLSRHGIDRMTASSAMRVSANWEKCKAALHLKDALKMIATDDLEQEIASVSASSAPIRCPTCQRRGQRPSCAECAALQAGKPVLADESAEEPEETSRPSANGRKPVQREFDFSDAVNHVGAVVRDIDRISKEFKVKASPEAAELKRTLGEFQAALKAWYDSLAKRH